MQEDLGLVLVEHREPRIDAGFHRIRAQQARAQAVDGADRGAIEAVGKVGPAAGDQTLTDAVAQLGRRPVGEGDRRQDVGPATVVEHGLEVPPDEE